MQRLKKVLCSLLTCSMAVSILPPALAAEPNIPENIEVEPADSGNEVTYPVEGGDLYFDTSNGTITDCDYRVTAVVIPASINGVAVTSIGDSAFARCSSLTSLTIPAGITSIGDDAFDRCTSLTSITIPDGVTSIGSQAFLNCSSLTNIVIPASVTSIGGGTFVNCTGLKSAGPIGSNSSYEFGWTQAIPDCAFKDCDSLTSITMPDSITSIGKNAFYSCKGLTSITIPASVTSIDDQAFQLCSGLTSITIPDNVTSIGEYAFAYCSGLTSITIPKSVTNIRDWAFCDCNSLKDVYYAGSEADWKIIEIGKKNESLTSATIHYNSGGGSEDDENKNKCGDNVKWQLDNGTLTISGTGAMYDYTTHSSAGDLPPWYDKNEEITKAIINDGVTRIGVNGFYNCSSLTNITIPDSVTSIGNNAFCFCSSLTNITLPKKLTSIEEMTFASCSNLTSITIPEGVTSIGNMAFSDCKSLKSVTIPDSVTSIDGSFCHCSSLTSITIPASVTSIGGGTFTGCSRLTSITIPDGITSIDSELFSGCSSLTSITIPKSVTSIGWHAFYECNSLKDVYYAGSEADWKAIKIDETGNEALTNATIHYKAVTVSGLNVQEKSTQVKLSDPNEKLENTATVFAAVYDENGRMTAVVSGTLDKKTMTVTFKEKVEGGWKLFFLNDKFAPLCEKIAL